MYKSIVVENNARRLMHTGVRRNSLVLMLFLFYLVGTHLRLSIYTGDSILVPMYLMLFSAAMLGVLCLIPLLKHTGLSLMFFSAFVLAQPVLTLAPESVSTGAFLGSLQLWVSVVSALAVIYALSTIDRVRLRKFLITIWCVFIVLAVIESAGLKPLFDQAREMLYSGSDRFVYYSEQRDLEIYGRVRTTVFASEPSFLADTLSGIILMIFFLDPLRGRLQSWVVLGAMFALSFILSPSFKMLFYLLAVLVWQFWPNNRRRVLMLLFGLFFIGFLLLIFMGPISGLIYKFMGSHLESGSFYGRIAVGPVVGWEALTTYPIFGYGIGNDEGLYPIIAQAWQDSGAFRIFPWFMDFSATDLMTNGFWWQWTFLGVIGGIIFTKLIMRLLARIGVMSPFRTVVCVWIVWYGGFAFVDPLSWYMIVIFSMGSIKHLNEKRINQYRDEVTP